MREIIKVVNEDMGGAAPGGVSAPMATLANTPGGGNAVPAATAAMTGAEQASPDAIGSGDKWGSGPDKRGKRKKRKKGKKRINAKRTNESNLNFQRKGDIKKTVGIGVPESLLDDYTIDKYFDENGDYGLLKVEMRKLAGNENLYWASYGDSFNDSVNSRHEYINTLEMRKTSESKSIQTENFDMGDITLYESPKGIQYIKHFDGAHDSNWITDRRGFSDLVSKFPILRTMKMNEEDINPHDEIAVDIAKELDVPVNFEKSGQGTKQKVVAESMKVSKILSFDKWAEKNK